jgi:hypothetical protein
MQVDEGWALLEGLRRRLDDHTAQNRKTQQQVTQLTESIAALVATSHRTRRINLRSFVAYLIFTVRWASASHPLQQPRERAGRSARSRGQRRDVAIVRADDLSARATAATSLTRAPGRSTSSSKPASTEATGKLAALRDLKLSRTERAILAARAHETQVMEVDNAIKGAVAAFKAGRHQEAIAPLEAALVGEPSGSRRATMRYYLGVAYSKTGVLEKAISYLQQALDAEVDQEDARFQLASALDRHGAWAKARVEYDKFATAHPQAYYAVYAMRRSAALARLPANAPADAKPDPAPAPDAKPATPVVAKPPVAAPGAPVVVPKPAVTPPPNPAVKAPPVAPKPVVPAPAPPSPSRRSPTRRRRRLLPDDGWPRVLLLRAVRGRRAIRFDKLRAREFAAGRYNPVIQFLEFSEPAFSKQNPGAKHETIKQAVAASAEDGTRSILDIDRVAAKSDYGVAAPLPPARLRELYDTDKPTREMVDDHEFFDEIERGKCVYIVVCKDGAPAELMFAGYSYD